jgi:hypothetical protein
MKKKETENKRVKQKCTYTFQTSFKHLPRLPCIITYLKTYKPYSNIDLNGVAKRQGIKCKQVWRCGDKIKSTHILHSWSAWVVRFTNPWTSTRYPLVGFLDYPHSYRRIYDVIHAKRKHDLIAVTNYILKVLQSKYDRFSDWQAISCVQAIRTITTDLHPLPALKISGAIPLIPLYAFMVWTVTLPHPYYHQSPSSHLIFLRLI